MMQSSNHLHEDVAAFAAARTLACASSRELSFFSQLLPQAKRDAACAIVAVLQMLREAINAANEESLNDARSLRRYPIAVSQARASCSSGGDPVDALLRMFAERLDQIEADQLELPAPGSRSPQQNALHAFALTVRRYQIPRVCFDDLASSFQTERRVARFATWRTLEQYLDQSGGSIARALACVVGMTDSGVWSWAATIGKAIRLLSATENIARDYAQGRLLLPLEDLAACRYSERDLSANVTNGALKRLVDLQVSRAEGWIAGSRSAIAMLAGDRERLAVTWLMLECGRRARRIRQCDENRLLTIGPPTFNVARAISLLPRALVETWRTNRFRESPARVPV